MLSPCFLVVSSWVRSLSWRIYKTAAGTFQIPKPAPHTPPVNHPDARSSNTRACMFKTGTLEKYTHTHSLLTVAPARFPKSRRPNRNRVQMLGPSCSNRIRTHASIRMDRVLRVVRRLACVECFKAPWAPSSQLSRKGTNGVSTNGVTANLMFFDRGTFWVVPLTYFYLPKSARAYLFPQHVKIHYFLRRPH